MKDDEFGERLAGLRHWFALRAGQSVVSVRHYGELVPGQSVYVFSVYVPWEAADHDGERVQADLAMTAEEVVAGNAVSVLEVRWYAMMRSLWELLMTPERHAAVGRWERQLKAGRVA